MTVGFRVDTATSPPQLTIVDFEELIGDQSPANSLSLFRQGEIAPLPGLTATNNFLWTRSGNGGFDPIVVDGYKMRRCSGAAVQTATYTVGGGLDHPMGADLAADPAGRSRPVRWTVGCVIHQIAPLVTGAPAALNLLGVTNSMAAGGAQGFEISSDLAINAGNWTVRRRNATGGAIVDVDTGIPGLTDVYAEIIYEHTSDPVLFARINGVEFGRVQGLANVPRLTEGIGGEDTWRINTSGGGGTALAAWLCAFRGFRVIIEELPGFV